MITALFNYAVDYFNLAENPCHKAGRMGKREVVVNFWTKDEFDRILALQTLISRRTPSTSPKVFSALKSRMWLHHPKHLRAFETSSYQTS